MKRWLFIEAWKYTKSHYKYHQLWTQNFPTSKGMICGKEKRRREGGWGKQTISFYKSRLSGTNLSSQYSRDWDRRMTLKPDWSIQRAHDWKKAFYFLQAYQALQNPAEWLLLISAGEPKVRCILWGGKAHYGILLWSFLRPMHIICRQQYRMSEQL